MFESLRPQIGSNCVGPSMLSVQQHCACSLCDVADASLCHAILVVRTDPAERHGYIACLDGFEELQFGEWAVISMVVANLDAVLCCEAFESLLGVNSFVA